MSKFHTELAMGDDVVKQTTNWMLYGFKFSVIYDSQYRSVFDSDFKSGFKHQN